MKTKEIKLNNFRITVSDKSVQLRDEADMWRMEYMAGSHGYGLILHLLSNDAMRELRNLLTVLYSSTQLAVSDVDFVQKLSYLCVSYVDAERPASTDDDAEALAEVRVMTEQSEEAVNEHIKLTKDE